MAHSIQTYSGRSEVIHDLDLLVVIGFASKIFEQSPTFWGLETFAEHLQVSLCQYGPGVIDLRLDEFVNEPGNLTRINQLLATILEQLLPFGETIPGDFLDKIVGVDGISFAEYKVALVNNAVNRLRELVNRGQT